jgi:hypothetical protein
VAGAAALRPLLLVRVGLAGIDLGVDLVVGLARARCARRGVDLAEVHLLVLGIGAERIGALVIRVRPLRRIRICRRVVQRGVYVSFGRAALLSHLCSSRLGLGSKLLLRPLREEQ